jgi:hypothetical protein
MCLTWGSQRDEAHFELSELITATGSLGRDLGSEPSTRLLWGTSDRHWLSYYGAMLIGDRTRHGIPAFRSPVQVVVLPNDAILHDVRTSGELG